ncbi:MAG: tyrosine-type recombinase/integrase [Salinisphaera sp.]|jgi:integrase/recombinase XerD|nr:tyrosine-type recombinase/integrase [Salinisphaera sp.]
MKKHNPKNERMKRAYLVFLKEAKRQNEASVDAAAKAISRFEEYTKCRDFKAFHFQQAVSFKAHLAKHRHEASGAALSKATMNSTLRALKAFFQWLALAPGYRARLNYSDAEYFNLSEKEARVATAKRTKPMPTMEQIKRVIAVMPDQAVLERRDRALMAFTLLTGARDSAIASMRLKHVDLEAGCVFQDAREVNTKASKTFTTYFFPVGDEVAQIVRDWITYLREELFFGLDDPLFPKTAVGLGARRVFEPLGLSREHWSSAEPIRKLFKKAFEFAGLPYFNPHSFRKTLVQLGERVCQSPEEFKAWSQNLGHEGVLTTFRSYGEVQPARQSEIFSALQRPRATRETQDVDALAKAVAREMRAQQGA